MPFSIWHKKTILAQANESASIIQDKFRAYITKKHTLQTIAKNKLQKLFRFNQLKNILSKINQAGNNKILHENRKSILNVIMKKKAYTDDKSALKRYLNKWKQYNTYTNNCVTKLANAFRTYQANKEKNRLKKINNILHKYVLKHDKIDTDQMRSKLRKWNNKSKLISYNLNSRRIQRFIRPKLARLLNKKFKKYFIGNAKKKVNNLLLMAAKFNKMKKSLERPSLQRFANNLKLISLKNNQNEKLKNVLTTKDNKNKELSLKKYLLKWRRQNNKITTNKNQSATLLQNAFRAYQARKYAKNQLFIRNILKKNILKKSKTNSNKIYAFFKRWLNTVRNLTLNRNAIVIQMFCSHILDKINSQKELSRKIRLNNFINKILTIKYGAKYAIDKIKNKRDEVTFIRFNNNLKQKRLNTLKEIFSKIKSRAFNNKLRSALSIPGDFHDRILKKVVLKWKENAGKLSSKRGAELLQKNIRIFLYKKKQENKKNILKHILLKLSQKNSNIKYKYFTKMHAQAVKISKNAQKAKLAKYIRDRFRISEARKKWINLAKRYSLRNRNEDLFTVVGKMKQYIAINKMKDPFIHKARVSVIQIFKDRIKKNERVVMLKKMLPERNDKNGHDTIVKYLGRWKLNAEKLRERQEKFKKALETIEKRDLIRNVNRINAAMLMKKLFSDIPKIRAKLFLHKLKNNQINKSKYEKLKNGFKNAKNNLLDQHKAQMMNKIYKIYAFNKLNNMFKALDKNLKQKTKPFYGKEFFQKLYANKRNKAQYKYGDHLKSSNKAHTIKMSFKNKIKANKPSDIIEDKNGPMKKCLPHFIKFIQSRLENRRRDTMDALKEHNLQLKFVECLKKYTNKTNLAPKKEMFDMMHRDALYAESRPLNQIKLFKLFRKKYIKELTSSLEEPAKLYHLYYLINVTLMHKKIAQQRFYRELIRKWRFAAFAKKMARKKLELMYKNLHASYLQMADEFFGDDSVNPSVIKEFEMFGNNVGMFTGENPQVGEELNKKYYANVEKKYIFANGQEEVQRPKKKKVIRKEKEEIEIEEEKSYEPKKKKDPFEKYKKK